MYHQLKSYLNFLFHATNQHGVHSPFVYDLVTQCLYDKKSYDAYAVMDRHRKKLYQDPEAIEVTDFGAGSRVFNSNVRKVRKIAKHVGIEPKLQYLLYRLVAYFQPENMLELGTSLGMGTLAMALGYPSGSLISLEGCPNTAQKAREYLQPLPIRPTIETTQFQAYLDQTTHQKYDLIYIDGHHSKTATLSYFNQLVKQVHNDSLLIFDDIHWSPEMTHAWKMIHQHPEVTVSIDTYHLGMVFFRKEQQKEHFKIRL